MTEEQRQTFKPWLEIFQKMKGRKYDLQRVDFRAMTTLIEMEIDPADFEPKIKAFLNDPHWWEYGRHRFHVFVNQWNSIDFKPAPDEKKIALQDPPISCSDCGKPLPHKFALCPQCYPSEIKERKP